MMAADCYGQTSLLVGHRSGAESRWVERGQAPSALGCFARRRYSACSVDSCRSFYFVGQPTMRFIQQLKNWSVPAQGVDQDKIGAADWSDIATR
jgi:hypothetical protein